MVHVGTDGLIDRKVKGDVKIDVIEDRIFVRFDTRVQQQVFAYMKDLLAIRRVTAAERDVMNELIRLDDSARGADEPIPG